MDADGQIPPTVQLHGTPRISTPTVPYVAKQGPIVQVGGGPGGRSRHEQCTRVCPHSRPDGKGSLVRNTDGTGVCGKTSGGMVVIPMDQIGGSGVSPFGGVREKMPGVVDEDGARWIVLALARVVQGAILCGGCS